MSGTTINSNQNVPYIAAPDSSGTLTIEAGVSLLPNGGDALDITDNGMQTYVPVYAIDNYGTVIAPDSIGIGLVTSDIGVISVSNNGTIEGSCGVGVDLGPTTPSLSLTNSGLILGSEAPAISAGTALITNTGTIESGVGAGIILGDGTVIDSGVISGGDGSALVFGGSGAGRLILDPGATLIGVVDGSTVPGSSTHLELTTGAGTLENATFLDFNDVTIDAGGVWTLGGDALGGASVVTNEGTLVVANGQTQEVSSIQPDIGHAGAVGIGLDAMLQVDGDLSSLDEIEFAGGSGTLKLMSAEGAVLDSLPAGAFVDLAALNGASGNITGTVSDDGTTIAVSDGVTTIDLSLESPMDALSRVVTSADGAGGIDVTTADCAPATVELSTNNVGEAGGTVSLGVLISDPWEAATGGIVTVAVAATNGTLVDPSASGSGTGTVTVTGTLLQVQAAFATLQYVGNGAAPDSISASLRDDAGGTSSASQSMTVYPGPQAALPEETAVEGVAMPLTGISVSDEFITAAEQDGTITVTLTSTDGTLLLSQPANSSASGSTALDPTGTLTLSGSVAAVNADLANLLYTDTAAPGDSSIEVQVADQQGASYADDVPLNVVADQLDWAAPEDGVFGEAQFWALQDAPDIALAPDSNASITFATGSPDPYTVYGDGTAAALLVDGDTVTAADDLTITGSEGPSLSVVAGQLTIARYGTILVDGTVVIGNGDGPATLDVAGTLCSEAVQINADATLLLTGQNPAPLAYGTVFNDGTLIVAPGAEATALGITTDTVAPGTLDIAGDATLTVVYGISAAETVSLEGPGAKLVLGGVGGAALAGLADWATVDLASLNAAGPVVGTVVGDGSTIEVSDGAHTVDLTLASALDPGMRVVTSPDGTAGVDVSVAAYDPASLSLAETGTIEAGGTMALGLGVVDGWESVSSGQLSVLVTAASGTLVDAAAQASGSGSGSLTIDGTLTQVQDALAGLSYVAGEGNGCDTVTVSLLDDAGGAATASQSITQYAGPAADVPDAAVAVDGAAVPLGGLSVSDDYVSSQGGTVTVTLTASSGTFALSQPAQSDVSGSTALDPTGTLTLSGSLDAVNADLANLLYTGGAAPSGSISMQVTDDQNGSSSSMVPVTVLPDELYWVNPADGAFAVAGNWTLGAASPPAIAPDQNALVVFATGSDVAYTVSGSGTAGGMLVAGDSLTTTGSIAIAGAFEAVVDVAAGELDVGSTSDLTVANAAEIGGAGLADLRVDGTLQAPTVDVASGGWLWIDAGGAVLGQIELAGGSLATALANEGPPNDDPVASIQGVTLDAGSPSQIDATAMPLMIDGGLFGTGQVDVSGDVSVEGAGDAAGLLLLQGATLDLGDASAAGSMQIGTASGTSNDIVLGAADNAVDSAGTDTIALGSGTNQVTVSGAASVTGGTGSATIQATGASVSLSSHGGAMLVTGSAAAVIDESGGGRVDYRGTGQVSLIGTGAAAATIAAMSGGQFTTDTGQTLLTLGAQDAVVVSHGTDTILGGSGAATVLGAGASTQVTGGAGPLLFAGGAGVASVWGGSGSTTLFGGSGGGLLQGGAAGGNVLVAQGGNTTLVGAGGADQMFAASGSTTLFGSAAGQDSMVGGQGQSLMIAGGSAVEFGGSAGGTEFGGTAATLVGGTGGSTFLVGGSGSTEFVGGAGDAAAFGGAGNDSFLLGAGSDAVVEGGGTDTVVFGSGSASVWGGSGADSYDVVRGSAGGSDIVVGFRPNVDTLNLSGYDAAQSTLKALNGSTVLSLSDGTRIELYGVADPATVHLAFG